MASRIPGFTSGLKPPTSQVTVTKRRGIEPAAGTQPVDKRPRTAEDAQSDILFFNSIFRQFLMFTIYFT